MMLSMYAAGGISVYWIVNLRQEQLEVYTDPSGPDFDPIGYRHCQVLRPGDHVPVNLDGHEVGRIAVADILPRKMPASGS